MLASLPQSAGRGAAAERGAEGDRRRPRRTWASSNSSEFSSLHPGYFVVFSGIYSSEREARGALDTAKATYPQAYARQIVQ